MEFVEIFENKADAARKNNICPMVIGNRVRGVTKRQNLPYGGYIWMTESQYNKIKNDR